MRTRDKITLAIALIVIPIGLGCWWWLGQEGYVRPAQRVIIVER